MKRDSCADASLMVDNPARMVSESLSGSDSSVSLNDFIGAAKFMISWVITRVSLCHESISQSSSSEPMFVIDTILRVSPRRVMFEMRSDNDMLRPDATPVDMKRAPAAASSIF